MISYGPSYLGLKDVSIKAAIVTGTGTYFTAGADIFSSISLCKPSTMIAHITKYNEGVFDMSNMCLPEVSSAQLHRIPWVGSIYFVYLRLFLL